MTVPHSVYSEDGQVSIDPALCHACGNCARVCPADVLAFDGHAVSVRPGSPFGCIACGHCMMVCPTAAISVTGRGLSPDDLMKAPGEDDKATPESLAALMEGRRSVRQFTDEEVSADVLESIVEMAASAPMGVPPWDVGCVIVNDRSRVQQLAGEITAAYERLMRWMGRLPMALMRPFMRKATREAMTSFILPLGKMLVEQRRAGRDVLFWNAPAVMIFHHSAYSDGADAYIACTYAMLAAESLGLGTTMIGSAAPVMQRDPAIGRNWSIPEGHKPAIVLILGYPATRFHRTLRRRFVSLKTIAEGNGQISGR